MEILLTLSYSLLFIWFIAQSRFFQIERIPRLWLISVFVLKIFFGIVFWYIYTYYYSSGDVYTYFNAGNIMFEALLNHPLDFFKMFFGFDGDKYFSEVYYSRMFIWSPRFDHFINIENHTIIRINALFRFFSFGYFQVHNVFINVLSFAGLLALYKAFIGYAPEKNKILFVSIFLFPTVLFWGSGVMKEGLILFALGFTLYYWNKLITHGVDLKVVTKLVLFTLLLFAIKITLCVLVVVGFIAWYLSPRIKRWPVGVNFALLIFLGFFGVVALSHFTPYNYFKSIVTKQVDFINFTNGGMYLVNDKKMIYIPHDKRGELLESVSNSMYKVRPGSDYYYYNMPNSSDTIYVTNSADTLTYTLFSSSVPARKAMWIPLLSSSPLSFIKSTPTAFLNVLVRPTLFESVNFFMMLAAIENEAILLLLLVVLVFSKRAALNEPAIWFCFFIVICFFIIIGWVTPSMGAIVRYKSVVFPFLTIAMVLLFNRERIFKPKSK